MQAEHLDERPAALLRRAGLLLLSGGLPPAPPPLAAVRMLVACRPDEGRRDGWVDEENPGLVDAANEGWFALAREHGLFDPTEREFLLGVPTTEEDAEWRRAKLLDTWDLFGAGAATGLLGSAAGRPEFVMSSLDGRAVMQGTTYHHGVTSIAMSELWRVPTVRAHMERIVAQVAQPNRRDGAAWYPATAQAWRRYVRQHR
ncbi:hypothetical protein [Streptomyces litchfieldiae]|uniref:Uncharacterized protein n=1 Tax=Streptomyces litchfieldiae TaxID=3075543 RepID=A0ABU2MXV3_9ACTN|nr:hypothetical protein [Streptomyces sp. DSM 44938]MDT0345854.1 hypothetical protein [Streptomyces sp. DSM 44938]